MEQDNQPEAHKFLDCLRCVEIMPKNIRATWDCGLLKPHERKGPGFLAPAHWDTTDVCPGYLIKLPQVIEAARAKMHWEKGLLKERYEDEELTGLLFDCLEILAGAVGEAEHHMYNEGKN